MNRSSTSEHVGRTALPTQDPDSDAELNPAETAHSRDSRRLHSNSQWSDADIPTTKQGQKSKTNAMTVALTHFTRRLIFPFFLITGSVSAAATVLAFFDIFDQLICIIVIVAVTWIASLVAMFGVWKWGAAEEYIEFAAEQNEEYQENNGKLERTRKSMREEVQEPQKHVEGLEGETMQLEQCMESFEELQEALKGVTEDDEEILKVVDGLNEQYNRMKVLTMEQDKSQLLLTYYRVQFSGGNDKFSKDDYE